MTDEVFDAEHIDPATVEDAKLDRVEPAEPGRLYSLWDNHYWNPSKLDFARDLDDWSALDDNPRSMIAQSIATFLAAEERISSTFAAILLSAEDEPETAFLATQQLDEVRHLQFFELFWRKVAFPNGQAGRAVIDDARARCNAAFTQLFDRKLMQAIDRVRNNPREADAKVEAVTLYHLVIEGMMGLTGLHFLLDYVTKKSVLPAFGVGLRNIMRDEHRHVAYGTWFLKRKCRERDRYGFIVQSTMMEALPIAAGVLVEGGEAVCDGLDPVEFLEYPSAAVNHFALVGLSRRLKVIGGATDEIQRFAASGAWRAARVLEAVSKS